MYEQYLPLIYVGIVLTSVIVGGKIFLSYHLKKMQFVSKYSPPEKKSKDLDEFDKKMESLIENAPTIQHQLENQIRDLEKQGVTKEQMGGILSQKKMIDFVASNQQILSLAKPFIKPILKKVTGALGEL